jgi:hypothetical protein
MRRLVLIGIAAGIGFVLLMGCASQPAVTAPDGDGTSDGATSDDAASEDTQRDPVPFVFEILTATEIEGLALVGTDEWPDDRIEFRPDGDLLITLEGETYLGMWRYDASRIDFPLTLDWTDGTPPEEYVARLALIDNTQYALEARWYYVDPRIRIYRRYVAE